MMILSQFEKFYVKAEMTVQSVEKRTKHKDGELSRLYALFFFQL